MASTSNISKAMIFGGMTALAGLGLLTARKRNKRIAEEKEKNKFALKLKSALNLDVLNIKLEEESFLELLTKLMSHSEKLQNMPPTRIPQEDLAVDCILEYLQPYIEPHGPLKVKRLTYVEGRSNLIVFYPGTTKKVVSFVGSHMDVVSAEGSDWKRDPFKLVYEDGKLYGRGVTDCLGHVALLTNLFKQLSEKKVSLKVGVAAVFIANEENSSLLGVGIDMLQKNGELDFLRSGPLFWVDSANFGPTVGTGGRVEWSLTAKGKKFHSGIPQRAINGIELATEAMKYIKQRFYHDFRMTSQETAYKFEIGSSIKETQISCPSDSTNLIPAFCTIVGDIRFTPFYSPKQIMKKVEQYVEELNVGGLPSLGYSKFELPSENLKGRIEWRWLGAPTRGVAVDLTSPGFKAICESVKHVTGDVRPFSLTGTLPIIADLKDDGFDVQVTGFGRMDAYHAVNEYAVMSEFVQGSQVVTRIIANLDAQV